MAKYMLIMRATDEAWATVSETVTFDEMLSTMGRYNEELINAGVLIAAEGMEDAAKGVVIDFAGEKPVVTDGPYGETKELFGGFYIIEVASQEEAIEWGLRMPMMVPGSKLEIRRVPGIDEFPQDSEWVLKEKAWRERTGQV
ncbi:YciI family protein [Actinoplanes sp. NPDC089786]|uniref:YciI family protein n=1 Tax=Actinoplanes sp. NPDC089786 TaxID=3155185 RepID=UPI003418EFE4